MTDASIAVVGAGLAGLVAARHVADAGRDVTVYERRAEVGGRVRSRERDGFTLDRGFQALLTAYPAVRTELDLDALSLRRFSPGVVVASDGERSVLSDPLRDPGSAVETLFNREVTISDKLRTLALRQDLRDRTERELFSRPDQPIRTYLREWGFSPKFVRNFVAPLYGGITLDRSLSTSRRVFDYTFKMLAEGHAAVPADGMGAIPAQLADRAREVGAEIRLSRAVERVDDAGDGATVTTEDGTVEADAVVVATDPAAAKELTGVESIPTVARGCITQYYRLPTELDAGKKLILNADDPRPNTVVPLSAVAPEYGDGDHALLNATFLGRSPFDRDDGELLEAAHGTLASWYPERSFAELDLVATDRIRFAQFDQPPGVHDGLPGARATGGSVYLAGDYTAWSSIQGAIRSGREAADALLADAG